MAAALRQLQSLYRSMFPIIQSLFRRPSVPNWGEHQSNMTCPYVAMVTRQLLPRNLIGTQIQRLPVKNAHFTGSRRINTKSPATYFVTSPIFYVNAAPHLGHLYSATLADAAHRFQVMLGTASDTIFCTGTDEHGLKIQRSAEQKGQSIRFFCDHVSSTFQELFDVAHVEYTSFIRTTQDSHVKAVQNFWQVLQAGGNLYKGKYEGWYCVAEETFLSESQLIDMQLDDGRMTKVSTESGQPVEWTEEPNYMFPLSKYKDDLLHWLGNADVVTPRKFGDIVKRTIGEGLNDISVSRSTDRLRWGIRVPGDDTQTVYVWLDALVAYLTAAGYPSEETVWPPDVQVIGKDILKFHCIYWPAFLMAAGLEPPHRIFCHSHWTVNNHKMSKSRGNVIDPFANISASSSDAVRYFLLREGVPHSDGNYSEEKFVNLVNAELCNTLGNLLSRCTALSLNESQTFPKFDRNVFEEQCTTEGKDLVEMIINLPVSVKGHYLDFNFYKGLESIMGCVRQANLFIQESKPWDLKGDPSKRALLETTLHTAMETLRVVAILLLPITPVAARRMLDRLGIHDRERRWQDLKPFACMTGNKNSQYEGRKLGADHRVLFGKVPKCDLH